MWCDFTDSYSGGRCDYLYAIVKMYDKSKMRSEAARMNELTNILKKAENDNEEINILEVPGVPGALAKCLAADIKNALEDRDIRLFYQLQYDNDLNV